MSQNVNEEHAMARVSRRLFMQYISQQMTLKVWNADPPIT